MSAYEYDPDTDPYTIDYLNGEGYCEECGEEVCEGCGHGCYCHDNDCECGPADDDWVQRAYERQAEAIEARRREWAETRHWLLTD